MEDPGIIAMMNKTFKLDRIIHGIRIRTFNNTGGHAQIFAGGLNFDFASIRVLGRSNELYVVIDFFNFETTTQMPTTTSMKTTSPIPDVEVQRWGIFNDQSILLSK